MWLYEQTSTILPQVERNYMVCFAVFTVFMTCALMAATKFKFKDGDDFNRESIGLKHFKQAKDTIVGKVKGAYDVGRGQNKRHLKNMFRHIHMAITHTVEQILPSYILLQIVSLSRFRQVWPAAAAAADERWRERHL